MEGQQFTRLLSSVVFMVFVAAVTGCAGGEERAKASAKYSTYPENIRKAIDSGDVLRGMTQEQVLLAIGETSCIDMRQLGDKQFDSWTYHADKYTGKLSPISRCPGDHAVIFENGYVIEGETK